MPRLSGRTGPAESVVCTMGGCGIIEFIASAASAAIGVVELASDPNWGGIKVSPS
jgi:hypothetical protein